MTRILITGAAGLVASALARAWRDEEVVALRHCDLDIADRDAVDATIARFRPDLIVNGAVIGVDECEANPELAQRINVDGPAHLAASAERILHFSTNYVLDVVNVYGATKLEGERAVMTAAPHALIVRTSWVFGRGKDSFLASVADKLERGERVRAISDTFASTTYVEDLVTRVIALVDGGASGIHHAVNDGVCSYETFAREAARLVGADESLVEPVPESRPVRRPKWTPMRADPPMRPWQEALADFISRRSESP